MNVVLYSRTGNDNHDKNNAEKQLKGKSSTTINTQKYKEPLQTELKKKERTPDSNEKMRRKRERQELIEKRKKKKAEKLKKMKEDEEKLRKKQEVQQMPQESQKYWLHIIIPTVSRSGNNTNYLEKTLDSVLIQTNNKNSIFSLEKGRIKITVINHNEPGKRHQFFELAQKKYSNLKNLQHKHHLEFITANAPSKAPLVQNKGLPRTFLQTHDVSWSLTYLAQQQITNSLNSELILFMEDDFIMCPHAMLALAYFIEKATYSFPNWAALRASYGFNGIIIKPEDLSFFATNFQEFVAQNILTPPDHLIYHLFQKLEMESVEKYRNAKSRANDDEESPDLEEMKRFLVVYRNNLFFHIGDISSFDGRPARYNPACHQYMYDWLMENEKFNNKLCPTDDISPCPKPKETTKTEEENEEERIIPSTPQNAHLEKWELNLKMEKYPYLVDFDKTHEGLCRKHFPVCPAHIEEKDEKSNSCRKKLVVHMD